MKISIILKLCIVGILIIQTVSETETANERSNNSASSATRNELKTEIQNKKDDYYSSRGNMGMGNEIMNGMNSISSGMNMITRNDSNMEVVARTKSQYVLPHMNREPDFVSHHTVPMGVATVTHNPPPVVTCPCAAQVRCKPCNVMVAEVVPDPFPMLTPLQCPCAPKLNCPVCPPLSLLHEIASKKAEQDQQLAYNLKNISGRISKYFDLVIKYAGDVVKFEKEAKEAAKKMEEASIKSQFARKNMVNTSEKARFIAKTGIVDNRPCGGMPCNMNPSANPPNMFGYYPDKVFPEEVDNIKDFMRDNFTTNVNGYTDENGNSLSHMEREAEGNIQISPMDDEDDNIRGDYRQRGDNMGEERSNMSPVDQNPPRNKDRPHVQQPAQQSQNIPPQQPLHHNSNNAPNHNFRRMRRLR